MRTPIRTAIVGCGVIAPVHARALALDGRARLVLACDPVRERALALGAERASQDWRDCLGAGVDLVVVCTPHHLHVEQAIAALEAGKHVLCEKPLGITPASVARLVEAAARARTVASGVFQHRCSPLARRLAELARQGDLGRCLGGRVRFRCTRTASYYASGPWRGRWATEGGALMINQAIHTLDLACLLAGEPRAVAGTIERRRLDAIECEDAASGAISLAAHGGGAAEVAFDCENDLITEWQGRSELTYEAAALALGTEHRLESIRHPSAALVAELTALDRARIDGMKLPGKDCYGDLHALQVQDVLSAITAGRPPLVPIAEAARVNQAVLALYASAAAGGAPAAVPAALDARPRLAS